MTDPHATDRHRDDAVPTDPHDSGARRPFRTVSIAAGAALTFLAPFLAVLVGVVMIGGERDRDRRLWLRYWILGSLVWLAIGGLVVAAVLSGGRN